MRNFSANVKAQLSQDAISVFFLVEWRATGDGHRYLRHTTFPIDISINGLGTFKALNGLNSVDAPKLSDTVDREVYKLSYLDADREMLSWVTGAGLGARCTVYIGFINTLNYAMGGAEPGMPMRNKEDLIMSYQGVVDTYGYSINSDGEFISTFDCSSPMAALDVVRPILTSPDSIKRENDIDACYDQVYAASAPVTLHWGSIA